MAHLVVVVVQVGVSGRGRPGHRGGRGKRGAAGGQHRVGGAQGFGAPMGAPVQKVITVLERSEEKGIRLIFSCSLGIILSPRSHTCPSIEIGAGQSRFSG